MAKNRSVLSWQEVVDASITNSMIVVGENVSIDPNVSFVLKGKVSDTHFNIGDNVHIMSNSIVYLNSRIGANTIIAHSAIVREDCNIGCDVVIGARCEIQENVTIGNSTKLNSNVLLSGGTKVGFSCWIFPNVVVTNDPNPPSCIRKPVTIMDYAVISVGCLIMPGVCIEEHTFIGPGSTVNMHVPKGLCVLDSKIRGSAAKLRMSDDFNTPAYPWTNRYP